MLPKFPLVQLLWTSAIGEPNIESVELGLRLIIRVHVFVCPPLYLHIIIDIREEKLFMGECKLVVYL
jgi:hypothetical protein